jgi:hypothetical protein
MSNAKRLKLRLFLEGQEVPVISASVQSSPNSPMLASIQIPPLSEGTKFKPRTIVHLFFMDYWDVAPKNVYSVSDFKKPGTNRGTADTKDYSLARRTGDKDSIETDIDNAKYKLLFGGEMVGFQWSKTPEDRALVLQCQDWSNYWDYAMQFNNTDLFGPGYKAMFSGGGTSLFTDFLEGAGEVVMRIVNQPSVQYPKLEGLMGGLIHLLEAIGGAYYNPGGKTFSGQNIFFSIAELRLSITRMICANDTDPSVKRLMGGGYDGLFGRTLGNLGDQVSFRKAINALQGIIFHESYPQPCPMYVMGSKGNLSGHERPAIESDPSCVTIVGNTRMLIEAFAAIINLFTESPSVVGTDTGLLVKQVLRQVGKMKAVCVKLVNEAKRVRAELAVRPLSDAKAGMTKLETILKKYRPGTFTSQLGEPGAFLNSVYDQSNLIINSLRDALRVKVNRSRKSDKPARLNQQIFRPDVWFSSPPRCNVLFPEHYFSLQYARSFLQEPTRLMLKTNDEFFGEDELFDCFYFAPKLEGLKGQKAELQKMLQGDIMSHEVYTGILPVFEKMGEFNIFGVRSAAAPAAPSAKAKAAAKGKKPKAKMPKICLAQRTCNFLFFRYRFGARKMSVLGTFNPYVACGFPGLIIDKYVDLDKLKKLRDMSTAAGYKYRPVTDMLGTHFLGNFTQVSHELSQSGGGRTSIEVQYPREYDETIEFLGVSNKTTQQVDKIMEGEATRTTDIAAIDPPHVGALGPNAGVIDSVKDVTQQYIPLKGSSLEFYSGPKQSAYKGTEVRIGVPLPAHEHGEQVVSVVGSNNAEQIVSINAYRIVESIPRYRTERALMPAEELIRPGWYGDCWHPSWIGGVYEKFFGTGAITDVQRMFDDTTVPTAADPAGIDIPPINILEEGASIQQATAFLLQTYSYLRMNGMDVDEFLRAYTWRPIATMVDMFGSSDLSYNDNGEVSYGVEGFHSKAFGRYDNLFGLVTPDVEKILGVTRGSSLAKRADTRKAKWDVVRDYVDAIRASRGILG